MPRKKLPAEYDIGFLRLHADGTIAATFRLTACMLPPVDLKSRRIGIASRCRSTGEIPSL